MSRAWTDEEARMFTAPCVDRWQWDAWLAAHDARVRRDAAREALDGLAIDLAVTSGYTEAEEVRDYRDAHYPEETP